MANPWFRLWCDMVNDPKWRTIARASKQEISRVIAVALHMMTCASNATKRGHTEGWNDEDVATALDIETGDVTAIREAMQGRVLEGEYLTGWEKRQPKREDDPSKDRVAEHRASKKLVEVQAKLDETFEKLTQRNAELERVTQCNAVKRKETLEEIREEEIREDQNPAAEVDSTLAKTAAVAVTATDLSIAFRKGGVHTQPADPRLIAFAGQGVTPETVAAACDEAKRTKPNETIGLGYVAKILERWAKEAKELQVTGASAPKKGGGAWWATDSAIIAKGEEFGMRPHAGEQMQQFKGRIQTTIDNGGRPPAPKPSAPTIAQAAEPKRDMSDDAIAMRKAALSLAQSKVAAP